MVLCARLVDRFVHRSHRSIAVVEDYSAVIAVNVDLLHSCFSGLASYSSAFGVSFWFFPSCLFNRYRTCFTGIVQPLGRVRHGRH